jgi:hypothetical protein
MNSPKKIMQNASHDIDDEINTREHRVYDFGSVFALVLLCTKWSLWMVFSHGNPPPPLLSSSSLSLPRGYLATSVMAITVACLPRRRRCFAVVAADVAIALPSSPLSSSW